MRKSLHFQVADIQSFTLKTLEWARKFPHFVLLNSNKDKVFETAFSMNHSTDLLVAASDDASFREFDIFAENLPNDWLFGHVAYDLKEETCGIPSEKPEKHGYAKTSFFVPQWVISIKGSNGTLFYANTIASSNSEKELQSLLNLSFSNSVKAGISKIECRSNKDQYIDAVSRIKQHIARGDVYEMNYCIEHFSENALIDPYITHCLLNSYSPAPFSAFYKNKQSYLMSSSPERYIWKCGDKIISQPIKGTAPRGKTPDEDIAIKNELLSNTKERAENIMITDLVRNDLARTSAINSVEVTELCGLYTFKHVHQLISTISATIDENCSLADVLRSTFPMGSMTGAPKISAVRLSEKYENFRRGLYSGAVGYIDPNNDFDFNVVIRSILYNEKTGYLSLPTGSAITAESNPEAEYNECLLKAAPLIKVLMGET